RRVGRTGNCSSRCTRRCSSSWRNWDRRGRSCPKPLFYRPCNRSEVPQGGPEAAWGDTLEKRGENGPLSQHSEVPGSQSPPYVYQSGTSQVRIWLRSGPHTRCAKQANVCCRAGKRPWPASQGGTAPEAVSPGDSLFRNNRASLIAEQFAKLGGDRTL